VNNPFTNFTLPLICVALLSAGCATDQNKDQSPKAQATAPQNERDRDPEIGMTKDQVIARYGKTDRITSSSEGELWVYMLNMGQAFIPFNFGYHPKVLTITFDHNTGKVVHWTYSH
jgi:outer membrane protein assembly factor BamE (lipoprotein component of BamABCDE complex)